MFSLLLATAMCAVADTPNIAPPAAARVPTRAFFQQYTPVDDGFFYYQPTNFSAPPRMGYGGCNCFCPTDDVDLFLPCIPAAPCPVLPVRAVATPRVNIYTPPVPVRICPRGKAPCLD